MAEENFNRIRGDDVGRFTVTTLQGKKALVRRLEKFDAEYEVDDYHIDGDWDSAIITVSTDDLRPLRYLVKT